MSPTKEQENIVNLLLQDTDFAVSILSLHYAFTDYEIDKYWTLLDIGDAHYSVYMNDTEQIYSPKFGLCFNENIKWTDNLKGKWQRGIWNPFVGKPKGDGEIPMSICKEIKLRYDLAEFYTRENNRIRNSVVDVSKYPIEYRWLSIDDYDGIVGKFTVEYKGLSLKEFKDIYESENKVIILYNETIWNNTLKNIITNEFVEKVFSQKIKDINKKIKN